MLKKDRNERREDLLRPSPYLGYDRDKLGMYLLSRGDPTVRVFCTLTCGLTVSALPGSSAVFSNPLA
ncbi:MAG: hypothetical protein JW804_00905 [Sedimentisphaerales bacterium]|nr:hypothetical protein [Sedimentisphaerales bacterium]